MSVELSRSLKSYVCYDTFFSESAGAETKTFEDDRIYYHKFYFASYLSDAFLGYSDFIALIDAKAFMSCWSNFILRLNVFRFSLVVFLKVTWYIYRHF